METLGENSSLNQKTLFMQSPLYQQFTLFHFSIL